MKKLISILQIYALIAYLCTPALAATGTVENVNFLEGQATNPNFIANGSAQKNASGFKAFSDGGTSIPVNLTGGTPNTTCVRSTSGALRGDASFLMTVNSGGSRQGEGCAFDPISIPPAYQGAQHVFSFPFTISGSIVSGDIIPYCYDVTNSALVAPTFVANPLLGASGQMLATFQVGYNPTPTIPLAMRCALYIARTSTGALTIKANDVKFSPTQAIVGMAGSNTQSNSGFTFSSSLVATSSNIYSYRHGDRFIAEGYFTVGTTTGSAAYIQLPSGVAIDTNKTGTNTNGVVFGKFVRTHAGSTVLINGNELNDPLFFDGANTNQLYFAQHVGTSGLSKDVASGIANSGDTIHFKLDIPASGYDSNVTMGQSSTVRMSSILANGTRVTGTAPTALGQYRSQLRAAAGTSFSDTNGAPAISPSSSNGMAIYYNTYSAGDSSGQPSKYDVFVGKNKNVMFKFYQATGFSGFVDVTPFLSGTASFGYYTSYDPSTGVATVVKNQYGTSTANAGVDSSGTGAVTGQIFWDAIVSENALAVGVQAPRSESVFLTGNGYGSTNTKIRNYVTVTNTGTAVTGTVDAVNGASVKVNEDGNYSLTAVDRRTTGSVYIGFSVDSTELTTNILSINKANRLVMKASISSDYDSVSVTRFFKAGQVLRCHQDGSADVTTDNVLWSVTKVSN